jgi:hypothetical protein
LNSPDSNPAEFLLFMPYFVLRILQAQKQVWGDAPHKIATQNQHNQYEKEKDERAHLRGSRTQGSAGPWWGPLGSIQPQIVGLRLQFLKTPCIRLNSINLLAEKLKKLLMLPKNKTLHAFYS